MNMNNMKNQNLGYNLGGTLETYEVKIHAISLWDWIILTIYNMLYNFNQKLINIMGRYIK
jgi:hypothetical protein